MIDIVIAVMILGFVGIGYRRGLLETVIRLVAFFVGIFFASALHESMATWLRTTPANDMIHTAVATQIPFDFGVEMGAGLVINVLAAVLLLLLFTVVLNIGLSFLRIVNWIPVIGGINRGLGALAGLGFGLLAVWTVLIFAQLFIDPVLLADSVLVPWFSANNFVLHLLF